MRSPRRPALAALFGALGLAALLARAQAAPSPAPSPSAAPSASAAASASASADPRPSIVPWRPAKTDQEAPAEAPNACLNCHSTLTEPKLRDPAKQHATSVHRDERLGCVGCHRGDPADPTVGAHKAAGFIAHPSHADVPEICGGCHSDAGFMRHINARLPVAQLALYRLSLHGKRTGAGDEAAPDCGDCHGRHNVLPPASPNSPVHRLNVAKLCGSCHADSKRMAKRNIPTDQLAKWERGVHGQAFKKGNKNAPTCTGCHGAHSATPPESLSVAHSCGRCHEEELAYFEQSAHAKGFRNRGLAECVACHGNHDIAPPSALLVGTTPDATCMKCHNQDEKPRKAAEDIAAMLRRARDRAAESRAAVARARAKGLHIPGAELALAKVTTAELKLRVVVHTLLAEKLEPPVAAVEAAVAETDKLIAEAEATRRADRRGYYWALAIAAALFVGLGLKQLEIERRQKS